ncbi:MAG: flagellar basal body rod protein FlgC [Oscillospiraceae bacterium]|jgi:flagellar basal-body rod protein FlgC|nr:flagellar basal body rod protein FlgC [Oscillospiraceae bacterium]
MGFLDHLNVPVSGMTAQRLRMEVIGQNVANATTTMTEDGGPYIRQITLFNEARTFKNVKARRSGFGEIFSKTLAERREMKYQGVLVTAVVKDEQTPTTPVYDPSHPHADEDGYYYLPNVDVAEEQMDAMAASQSYENNYAVYDTLVAMAQRALSMGK